MNRIDAVKPPSVLLFGPTGTGKTYSVTTLLEAGLETFVIITEPNGLDTLLDSVEAKGLPIDRLHWRYVPPASPGFGPLVDMATTISRQSYDDLTKIKSGIAKRDMVQMLTLLKSFQDFVDDRTGQSFGDVTEWGQDRALVIDSLSGVNVMAMDMTIGMKPAAHQGEWGVAMNLEEKLFLQLTSDLKCFFVLIAHADKEPNELTGVSELTIAALGRKLAPKLGRFFSEVVYARRGGKNGSEFLWSTAEAGAALKNRGLGFSDSLPPDFGAVWKAHLNRLKKAGTSSL